MMVAGGVGALAATAPLSSRCALRLARDFCGARGHDYAVAVLIWRARARHAGSRAHATGLRAQWARRALGLRAPSLLVDRAARCFGFGSFMAVQGLWSVPWLMEVNGLRPRAWPRTTCW